MPRFLPLGDTALTIEFGDRLDAAVQAAVQSLDEQIMMDLRQTGAHPTLSGVIESIPSFRSLTLVFDPAITDVAQLQAGVMQRLAQSAAPVLASRRHWRLPVCYDPEWGLDLLSVAQHLNVSPETVVQQHVQKPYRVHMLGFLPGFAFLGDVIDALHLPRRPEPRLRVPAGSVAVAAGLTAVYPWESPGGWHVLGRCPIPLFHPHSDPPAMLAPGDAVRFEVIDRDRFETLSRTLAQAPGDAWAACLDPGGA